MPYPKSKFVLITINLIIALAVIFTFGQLVNAQETLVEEQPTEEPVELIEPIIEPEPTPEPVIKEEPKESKELKSIRIFYQGILSDLEGNPIKEGKYNLNFKIYDQEKAGNIIWQEEYTFYNALFIKDGNLKILLGRNNAINLNLNQAPFWLSISIGNEDEENQIIWEEEITTRKKITTLSEILGSEQITKEQWENLSQLIREKLGDQTNVVILFDIEQLNNLDLSDVNNKTFLESDSYLANILQDLVNFLSEKISRIEELLVRIMEKIDSVIVKIDNIISSLANIGDKIDVLYDVLIVEQGLEPEDFSIQEEKTLNIGNEQVYGTAVIRTGKSSIEIFEQTIQENSLVFIAFIEEPQFSWNISKNLSSRSFLLNLEEEALEDLEFNYWITNIEEEDLIKQPSEQPAETPEPTPESTEPIVEPEPEQPEEEQPSEQPEQEQPTEQPEEEQPTKALEPQQPEEQPEEQPVETPEPEKPEEEQPEEEPEPTPEPIEQPTEEPVLEQEDLQKILEEQEQIIEPVEPELPEETIQEGEEMHY